MLKGIIISGFLKVVGKDVTLAPHPADKGGIAMGILSKLLYGKAFSWLIRRLNETLVNEEAKKYANSNTRVSASGSLYRRIGILDIAGFESFVFNTWEQLCINLSNECLQQHFNDFVFKTELADYAAEGILCGHFLSLAHSLFSPAPDAALCRFAGCVREGCDA